jgi:hypothetical protein
MVKPSYVDELGLLAASYTWAAREDISPISELLDIVVSGTALYIGSGGALAVSALASALHVAKTGRLATHGTPLAVSGGPLRHSTAAVLFSARAGHPDVALAARRLSRDQHSTHDVDFARALVRKARLPVAGSTTAADI